MTLRAGVGRADITPPVGIPAGGWGNQAHEISTGNDLELWASVLVVEDADGARAALADIDLCLLDDEQAARARDVIADAAGVPTDRIAVGTTHNHSVPVTLEIGGGWIRRNRELVAPYVESVLGGTARAAAEAVGRLEPVRIGSAAGSSPLAVNRRMTMPDGKTAVGLNPGGPSDRTLTVVRLDGEDDRPVATVVHYSCHPIILGPDNTVVTPEYPGIVKRVVESALGGRCLFVQGYCGDVGPSELFVPELESYRRLGAMIGHEAAGVAQRASWRRRRMRLRDSREQSAWIAMFEYEPDEEPSAVLGVASASVRVPLRVDLGDPDGWARQAAGLEDEAYAARAERAPQNLVRELTVQTKFARMRSERGAALRGLTEYELLVRAIRLGPVALVGVPVELFCELGMEVQARSPFATTLVSGYWNGYRNYLPTDAERARGGYEIDISPFAAGAAKLVTDTMSEILLTVASATP